MTRLQAASGIGHNSGEYQQGISSTEQYGGVFLPSIEQEMQQKSGGQ
jgi:hypothetical protein